jgi:electron transfer flavoprotein alpha subunit
VNHVKRNDPRRRFTLTQDGRRRIDLGDAAALVAAQADAAITAASKQKPLRQPNDIQEWNMAIAHSDRGRLDDHARQTIAAAAILAGADTGVVAIVLGDYRDNASELGCDHIIVLPDFDAARFQPDTEAAAVAALIAQYGAKHVFIPDSLCGDGDLGRRLIAIFGQSEGANIVEIDEQGVGISWSDGTAIARCPMPRIILLEPGAVDANLPFVGAAERKDVMPSEARALQDQAYRDLGIEQLDAAKMALEEADFIVSGGNGVRKVETLNRLASAIGAAVGASRVAADDGRFQRDQQIGASGKTVTASTYIAVGISGAIQHVQGIKDCRHVIAINRDRSAPIIKRADLSIIGDAEDVMQALINEVVAMRRSTKAQEGA